MSQEFKNGSPVDSQGNILSNTVHQFVDGIELIPSSGGGGNDPDPTVDAGALAVYDWTTQTYSDGDPMESITDKTSNGNDADAFYWVAGAIPIGSAPTYDTDAFGPGIAGTGDFINVNGGFVVPRAIADAMVASSEGTMIAIGQFYDASFSTTLAGPILETGTKTNSGYHPYTNNRWYDTWSSDSARIVNGEILSAAEQTAMASASMMLWEADSSNLSIVLNNTYTIASKSPGTLNFNVLNNFRAASPSALNTSSLGVDVSIENRIKIGAGVENTAGSFFRGRIGYAAFFDRKLTSQEKSDIFDYLQTKFGIP
jgi:hypothetical protein